MREVVLDADGWRDRADFYAALLPAIGAADWVGGNLDALFDALAGNSALAPPYRLIVRGAQAMPVAERDYIGRAERVFADAAREFGIDIGLRFEH